MENARFSEFLSAQAKAAAARMGPPVAPLWVQISSMYLALASTAAVLWWLGVGADANAIATAIAYHAWRRKP